METVHGHPIAPVPTAIFHAVGTMRKTNKAESGHQLEGQCRRVSELPESNSTAIVCIKDSIDTMMLLHAVSANADFGLRDVPGTIIIRSPDTDVLVLVVQYFPKMANTVTMLIETGIITSTTDKRRFVHVHSICAALGFQFGNIVPAVQALTGYDSVSSLFGIGKKTEFRCCQKKGADRFKGRTS